MQQVLRHGLWVASYGVDSLLQLLNRDAEVVEPALNMFDIVEIDWTIRRLIHG